MHWVPAYVGLGSNLDEPQLQVQRALASLRALPRTQCLAHSRLYASQPMGPQDQPQFINAAAGFLTQLSPRELLAELQRIEREMGRTPPPVRWGPRRIDLDLLLYDNVQSLQADLTLPHPGVHERNFVLYPLAEIAPALMVPGQGLVGELAQRLGPQGLRPLTRAAQAR